MDIRIHAPPDELTPTRRRRRALRALGWAAVGLPVVAVVAWGGLRFEPAAFPPPEPRPGPMDTTPLPTDLPLPVARFLHEVYGARYGDEVPVVDSAIISGRGQMRVQGVTLPVRFRFSHDTGDAYRHHIEATMYRVRLLTVHETYLDGTARLELPFGVSRGPQVDQGANLALWAEAVWMPSVWVTDPRVRWEAIDETSARLLVPFGGETESFTVTFDPATGLLTRMESLRFQGPDDDRPLTTAQGAPRRFGSADGVVRSTVGSPRGSSVPVMRAGS